MGRLTIPVFGLALCLTALIAAQATLGRIHGTVRDADGALLAGASVTLAQGSARRQATTTDARGEFAFSDLMVGAYTISVEAAGFTAATRAETIGAGAIREVRFVLQPIAGDKKDVNRTIPPVATEAPLVGGVAGFPVRAQQLYESRAFGSVNGGFTTEAYDKIDDNRWTSVGQKPLSTFSTDVDTASYANVRRFLNGGQMPPKDAVRIEELINYFSYDYPEPTAGEPFSVTAAIGECPWNPANRLALIGIQARHLDLSKTPPRNLVFLVDVSGSMMHEKKLPLVKASLAMLARNLTDKDRIALVVYAGAAGLVLPSTRGGDPAPILEALSRLESGGSTNGAQGLALAYSVARDHFIKGGSNRVVLATDGDFNVGVTSQGDLIRLIEDQRESGVTLSVLGYGMGNLKDSTMEKLADRGNGNYSYIDSLTEAQKVLVDEASGTLVTVAKDVKLQVEFNPRVVSAYRLIGYENRILQDQDFNDDRKDAGDIGAGHSVTALYELAPAGSASAVPGVDPLKYQEPRAVSPGAASDEAMTVKLRYKQPEGTESALISVPVSNRASSHPALGFAAAVAEFGMLLRDSEFKGASSYDVALGLATQFKGVDAHGHRAEFARLVSIADSVSRLQSRRSQQ